MMIKKTFLYKFGRFILGPIFKIYYHPQIIDKKNLNVSGSKIIVSNHIHLFDQCPTIISSKLFISYMAKKEYFKTPLKRFFFTKVGCIPVDRSKKDSTAKNRAIAILNNNGTIGLFPEGTRNTLKKDLIKDLYYEFNLTCQYKYFYKKMKNTRTSQINHIKELIRKNIIQNDDFIKNIFRIDAYLLDLADKGIISYDEYYDNLLLDLKFGAVSIAQKTDSYIIPSIITGEYCFRSKKLCIKYGKCFKVTNLSLEEANTLLRQKLIELLKENIPVKKC